MKLIRLADLSHNERRKISARQKCKAMSEYIDSGGYVCYDEEELAKYTPRKVGRKPNSQKLQK